MTTHVMLDLETLGTSPLSAIASLGAIAFDPEGDGLPPLAELRESNQKFYARVGLDSCLREGLQVDGSTISWWLRQDENARRETAFAVTDGLDLQSVLWAFRRWYQTVRPVRLWSNGASFDIPILEHAYWRVRLHAPWDYKAVRDMRTRLEDAGMKYTAPDGEGHHALRDAYNQAKVIQESTKRLKGEGS